MFFNIRTRHQSYEMLRLNQRVCDMIITVGAVALFTSWIINSIKVETLNSQLSSIDKLMFRVEITLPAIVTLFSETNDIENYSDLEVTLVSVSALIENIINGVSQVTNKKVSEKYYENYKNVVPKRSVDLQSKVFIFIESAKKEFDGEDTWAKDYVVSRMKMMVSATGMIRDYHMEILNGIKFYNNLSFFMYVFGSTLTLFGSFIKIFAKKE